MKKSDDPRKGDARILVVEDDEALATGLERNLRFDGYDVRLSATGGAALVEIFRFQPHVVVLDIMLPDISGFDVLERLPTGPSRPEVIILSALGREDDKVRGLKLGADDYLAKPFGLAELLARVEAAVRRAKKVVKSRSVIELGRLMIDRESRLVKRDGIEVHLTGKEFELLLALLDASGRVLSREELLRKVWGWDYDGTARTVDNFVRNLRKKIEEDPTRPHWIRTVHGVGYQFGHDDGAAK